MPDHTQPQPEPVTLDPGSAAAADRAFKAGLSTAGPGQPAPTQPEARLLQLLALLDPPREKADPERDRLLIDVTMARVLRSRDENLAGRIGAEDHPGPRLCPSSAEALDAAASSAWDTADPRLSTLLGALDTQDEFAPASARERLIQSTLAKVQSGMNRMRLRPSDEELAPRSRMRITLNDVLAAAAAVILTGVIIAPMIVNARATTRETLCAANMGRAGLGFSLFAADHDGALPSVRALEASGRSGTPKTVTVAVRTDAGGRPVGWWFVGSSPASHSANLFTLVRAGYATASDLTCPGNPDAQSAFSPLATDWASPEGVSYSYQLFSTAKPRWSTGRTSVVLADKSPVIDRARRGETPDPLAPSNNHVSRGQNVLFNNGAVQFLSRPLLDNGDNIWLPRNLERLPSPTLNGVERPQGESDAFVGP